jgi:hypothetical protein
MTKLVIATLIGVSLCGCAAQVGPGGASLSVAPPPVYVAPAPPPLFYFGAPRWRR